MEFLTFEENGGRHRWRIVAGDGGTVAQLVSFASYLDAERAARHVTSATARAQSVSSPAPSENGRLIASLAASWRPIRDSPDTRCWRDSSGAHPRRGSEISATLVAQTAPEVRRARV
jgi:hypothetical protein